MAAPLCGMLGADTHVARIYRHAEHLVTESTSSLLQAGAEIAVAFVGFASLIGVFVGRSDERLPRQARLILRSLLDYALFALLACGIPLLVAEIFIEPSVI